MVDGWVRGQAFLEGGCLVDFWVEFGKKPRAVVRGIVWWVVLGLQVECRVIRGSFM